MSIRNGEELVAAVPPYEATHYVPAYINISVGAVVAADDGNGNVTPEEIGKRTLTAQIVVEREGRARTAGRGHWPTGGGDEAIQRWIADAIARAVGADTVGMLAGGPFNNALTVEICAPLPTVAGSSAAAAQLADLGARARAGERIPVRCTCGYGTDGNLLLVDRYTQDAPPGPRGRRDWLEVWDDKRDEGLSASSCPECDEAWPDAVVELLHEDRASRYREALERIASIDWAGHPEVGQWAREALAVDGRQS